MKRGIIMQVSGRQCVVMTADGEFRKIQRTADSQVGQEVPLDMITRLRFKRFKPLWMPAVAVLLLLVVLPRLWTFETAHAEVAAYVSMDINPSLEMGIDQDEQVVELKAWNLDGEHLIDGLTYKGQTAEQVTASIMKKVQIDGYLASGTGDVVITSVVVKENEIDARFEQILTDKIDHAVEAVIAQAQEGSGAIKVTVLHAPKELREVSNAKGISPGKMAVYLLAQDEGRKLPLEALKQESINRATQEWGGLESIVGTKEDEKANKERLKQLSKAEKNKQFGQDQEEKKNKEQNEKSQKKQDGNQKTDDRNGQAVQDPHGRQAEEPAKNGQKNRPQDNSKEEQDTKHNDQKFSKKEDQDKDKSNGKSGSKDSNDQKSVSNIENENNEDQDERGNEKNVSIDRPIDVKTSDREEDEKKMASPKESGKDSITDSKNSGKSGSHPTGDNGKENRDKKS